MYFFLLEVHAHKQTRARGTACVYPRNPVTISHTGSICDNRGRDGGTGTRYRRNLKVKSPEIFGDGGLDEGDEEETGETMRNKDTGMSVGRAVGRFNAGSPRHW